jgi:hypothetical protein
VENQPNVIPDWATSSSQSDGGLDATTAHAADAIVGGVVYRS